MIGSARHCIHPATLDSYSSGPRMVYFRWPLSSYPPFNQRLFERLFIDGLSAHFDLVVVETDCDYTLICDLHQPDICLFESGNNNYAGPYTTIINTHTHPQIPKLGFMRSDPMCPSRTTFLAEMERWGIETYFTYVSNAGDYLPEIADRIFYWPFFIDTSIYRDYGQEKLLPILFLGNTDIPQYEWRKRIRAAVSDHFQTVVLPHVGYDRNYASQALFDERFSRLINSAAITPTCGGMVKALVNKHLEIPASASLLLTEESPIMKEFGFVHMETCVFADESDVRDTVDFLFRNPDELQRITRNGYNLVHSRHTVQQRTQILQWYQLHTQLKPGQRIVQSTICGDLRLVDDRAPDTQVHVVSGSTDRRMLDEGWQRVERRQLDDALPFFARCLEFTSYMAEPRLGFAVTLLLTGRPADAIGFLRASIETILTHGGLEPDPIEWSYWLIALLCLGRIDDAVEHAQRFPALRRTELERARWAVWTAAGMKTEADEWVAWLDGSGRSRYSIHAGRELSLTSAVAEFREMLIACGQAEFAERVGDGVPTLITTTA